MWCVFHYFVVVNAVQCHNHDYDLYSVRRGLLIKRIHERINKNPTAPVRRVFDKETLHKSDEEAIPAFVGLRTRIKRFRATLMPPIPHDINDAAIQGEWTKTWKGRRFLSHVDNGWGLVVFTTDKMLKVLQKCRCLYIDGTF